MLPDRAIYAAMGAAVNRATDEPCSAAFRALRGVVQGIDRAVTDRHLRWATDERVAAMADACARARATLADAKDVRP